MVSPRRTLEATREYYDEFSHRYEAERRPNRPDGYHALLDDLGSPKRVALQRISDVTRIER